MEKMFNLAKIISSMLIDRITNQRKGELDDWEREARENSHLLEKIMDNEHIRDDRKQMERFDKSEGWQNICEMREKKVARRNAKIVRIGRSWKYVAAISVIVLGTGVWMMTGQSEPEMKLAEVGREKTPVENKKGVQLKLQDGRVVNLGESDGKMVVDSGVVVRHSGSLLSYEANREAETDELVYNEIYVPKGAGYQLKLSDGTIIHLNAMSRVRYPVTFSDTERMVELEGEAFLEVAKDEARPFIVKTQFMDVKVLGTKFNISSYGDDQMVRTTLVEGSVWVSSDEMGIEAVLKPDEQLAFNKENRTAEVLHVDVGYYTAWRDGWFRFRDVRLEELMKIMMRWYDVKVVYKDPEVKNYLFGCNFNRWSSIASLIRVFGQNGKIKIEQKDDMLILMKGKP